MVVDRDRENFFRFLLADHERVEVFEDRGRRGNAESGFISLAFAFFWRAAEFLLEDVRANADALVADVNAGTGDEFFDLRVALSAERAHGEIGGAGHRGAWVLGAQLSADLLSASAATASGSCLRLSRTLSTRP